jgi:hypothetical protein
MRSPLMVATLLAGTVLLPFATHADDPGARVARVSYVSGDASYQRGDVEGWNNLRVNTPLVTGDSFYAPDGGRAEVDLGSGIVVRVDGGTEVNLVNYTGEIAQLGINSGVLDLSARSFPQGFTLEIDTPSAAATFLEAGRYRVDVTDRLTTYAVLRGSMSLAVNGQQLDVREGESLELENTDPPTYGYGRPSGGTPFQSWADDRDSRFFRSPSARYVNANVVGYEDLDDHGTWRDNRDYGRVWVPSGMSHDWAPYQSGRWIWQDPYGWTWVSTESWGWAPYHYGRWVYVGNAWGWVPPPPVGYRGPQAVMNIQPVYAPALVAFVGGRNWGLSISIGGPAIGWVPLAPRESYYYPWQAAPRVANNYTNITVVNAVTVVNYNTFTTNVVRPIRVDRAQIEQAPVIGYTAVDVVPVRGSLVVSSSRSPGTNSAPRPAPERPMVTRLVPPPRPEPFSQKVVRIERTGRPVAIPVVAAGPVGKPFVPGVQAPAGVSAVSALAPGGQKELKARHNAEARAPTHIERDIAPPTPTPGNGHGRPPQNAPKQNKQPDVPNAPETPLATRENPPPPATQSVPPPMVKPEAAPTPVNGHGKPPQNAPKQNKNPIVTSPPAPAAKPVAPPAVTPETTPANGTAPAKPPPSASKKAKKANAKHPPVPPTPPGPPPSPEDGR